MKMGKMFIHCHVLSAHKNKCMVCMKYNKLHGFGHFYTAFAPMSKRSFSHHTHTLSLTHCSNYIELAECENKFQNEMCAYIYDLCSYFMVDTGSAVCAYDESERKKSTDQQSTSIQCMRLRCILFMIFNSRFIHYRHRQHHRYERTFAAAIAVYINIMNNAFGISNCAVHTGFDRFYTMRTQTHNAYDSFNNEYEGAIQITMWP